MIIDTDGEVAKVSEYVTIKIGLPNYSNVELSFGHTRPCANNAHSIKTMAKRVHMLNMEIIEERISEYVDLGNTIVEQLTNG